MAITKRKLPTPITKEEIKKEDSSSSEEEVEVEVEEEEEEEEEEDSSEEEEDESSEDDDDEDDENDDEETKRLKLRKLLEPFGKEQIIGILKDAALTDPNVLSRVTQLADSDPTHRNIFIHGLSYDSTQDQLHQAFHSYGEIEDYKLLTDKDTGRAKGYGFVTFKTRSAARRALKIPQKKIGSRIVSCQLAALGHFGTGTVGDRKIFVGNVNQGVNPDRLRAFFEAFGEIEEGPIGLDSVTKKPRGFAIFVYRTEEGLNKALLEPVKSFEGCQLTCRKFLEGQNGNNKNPNVNAISGSNQNQGNIGNVVTVNPNPGLYAAAAQGVSTVNPGLYAAAQNVSTLNPGMYAGPNVSTVNPGMYAGPNVSTVNPGLYAGPNVSAGGGLMSQPQGVGLVGNPMMASNYNQAGFGGSGVMGAMAGSYGINSISPSVIGSYGYGIQAALQGLGAYQNQNSQVGQSSNVATVRAAAPGTVPGAGAAKTPSVAASSGMPYPSYPSY